MEHKDLIKIIRRQRLSKLILPLLLIIVSAIFILINPFKDALKPVQIKDLSEIESKYESGNKYIKCTVSKLYYSGFDYTIGHKTKANIYYTLLNGRCYYIIIATNSNNGIATSLDNFTFSARLIKNDGIYSDINRYVAEQINFSEKGMSEISSSILVSQYDYSRDFARFALISFVVILAVSSLVLTYELIATINLSLSQPVSRLRKYGDKRTLFALAVSELDTAVAIGRRNVFVTNSFLIIITRTDTDIIPLDNITWVYDFNEIHHKKGSTKMYHPICIITDARKMYKIRHVSETGVTAIINAIVENHPGIMVGYNNSNK